MKFTKEYQPTNRRPRGKGRKTVIEENRKRYEELFENGLSVITVKKELLLELMSIENKSFREYELINKIISDLLPYQEIMMTQEVKVVNDNTHLTQSTNDVLELYKEIVKDDD